MASKRYDRRSFLARVIGGTVGGSTLMILGEGASALQPVTSEGRLMTLDADPSDPAREPPPVSPPPAASTPPAGTRGVTDADTGAQADPVGNGRGRRGRAGISDSDAGSNADAVGSGRGAARPAPPPAAASPAPRESFVICPGHPRCPR